MSTRVKDVKEALTINALRARVYIYMRQLSSLRAPTWWLIDLTVATCHIQSTSELMPYLFPRENGLNTQVRHFGMI